MPLPGRVEIGMRKAAVFGLSPETQKQLLMSVLYGAGGAGIGWGLGSLVDLSRDPHDNYDSKAHGARIGAAIGALLPEIALAAGVRAPGY